MLQRLSCRSIGGCAPTDDVRPDGVSADGVRADDDGIRAGVCGHLAVERAGRALVQLLIAVRLSPSPYACPSSRMHVPLPEHLSLGVGETVKTEKSGIFTTAMSHGCAVTIGGPT